MFRQKGERFRSGGVALLLGADAGDELEAQERRFSVTGRRSNASAAAPTRRGPESSGADSQGFGPWWTGRRARSGSCRVARATRPASRRAGPVALMSAVCPGKNRQLDGSKTLIGRCCEMRSPRRRSMTEGSSCSCCSSLLNKVIITRPRWRQWLWHAFRSTPAAQSCYRSDAA